MGRTRSRRQPCGNFGSIRQAYVVHTRCRVRIILDAALRALPGCAQVGKPLGSHHRKIHLGPKDAADIHCGHITPVGHVDQLKRQVLVLVIGANSDTVPARSWLAGTSRAAHL
eukprot:6115037-Prymnesium_polylepis.2